MPTDDNHKAKPPGRLCGRPTTGKGRGFAACMQSLLYFWFWFIDII
ncbi:uncharacterized protein METZ01_LOCUS335574, partial [marine metagenome]